MIVGAPSGLLVFIECWLQRVRNSGRRPSHRSEPDHVHNVQLASHGEGHAERCPGLGESIDLFDIAEQNTSMR